MKRAKFLALLLASLLTLSTFTGCSGNDSSSSTEGSSSAAAETSGDESGTESSSTEAQAGEVSLPIVDEKITITWFAGLDSNLTALVDNMSDTPFFQELEEKTNIHIEFNHPAAGNETTAYNLLFASGDLPDMISHQNPGYPGGLDA